MAEVEHEASARVPVEAVWEFVREMDHWAPMLFGYQRHWKEGPDDSVWVLEGKLGPLARRVDLRVHVTEWAGPQRVRFSLAGRNEPVSGSGEFRMRSAGGAGAAEGSDGPRRRGPLARAVDALAHALLRLARGAAAREAQAGEWDAGAPALATLCFRLRLEPGGPLAPMIDALLAPALRLAAEDLASRIVAHVEARHGLR